MKTVKKLICIFLALVSIIALNACGNNTDSRENNQDQTYPPATSMTIKKIFEDTDENALRAEETHMGKRYNCNAQVVSVGKERVHARVWSGSVYLYYNEDQKDFVMNLSVDDVFTFEGTVTELSSSSGITFEDVVFVEVLYNNTPNGIYHHVIEY